MSHFELAPLTIFLGPNGSGKSAVLDALGLLSQTAGSYSNRQGFEWKGRWVNFDPIGKSALHNGRLDLDLLFGLDVHMSADLSERNLAEINDSILHAKYFVRHNPAKGSWEHTCELGSGIRLTNRYGPGPNQQPFLEFENAPLSGLYNPQSAGGAILSPQLFNASSVRASTSGTDLNKAQKIGGTCATAVEIMREWLVKRVFLVGPDRLPSEEDPDLRKVDFAVGRHGQDTLNLLSYLFASPEYSEVTDKIQSWGQVFGLRGLKAGWVRQKELQAGFNDPETKTALSLQHAGYGSQQILPVIAQIFAAPKQSTLLVEEPEISLHPGAQVEIMRLLGDAIRYGQQILLTTHSQILPLALSELEQYAISPTDVAIYHLTRGRDSVNSQRLVVDSKWNLPGWVPSFSDVDARLLKTWISKVHGDIQ